MPRDIDERKKRKALRRLRKAQALAQQGLGPPLSDWEQSFLDEVETRIETYGSAFGDPGKGNLDEPLSALQHVKLKEIDRKARGKGLKRGGRSARRGHTKPDHPEAFQDDPPEITDEPAERPHPVRPSLRIIKGGKSG